MRDSLVERFQSELSDRYSFEREIGRGGMAVVFLARDHKHERQVAVKVLNPEFTTALGTERFLREVRITAQLQHPHILTLIDSGTTAGLCYFVMPYVEGESLRDKLVWTRQLPVVDAVRIAREIASALAYAHGRGIVHRDIKPENVLLGSGQAIVADFGVARAMDGAVSSNLTVGGIAIGTPAYMSPEQAAGRLDVDGRADVYGLGCVLYEMLAGRPPFTGPTAVDVIRQQLETRPAPLETLRPGLSPSLLRIVEKSLEKDPLRRYPGAEEMHDDLRLELAGEVLQHRTPNSPHTPVQPGEMPAPGSWFGGSSEVVLRRPRRWVAAGAAVAAALLAVLFWAPHRANSRAILASPFSASIAAMPLDHYGSDSEGAMLSEGLTEEIISRLSMIKGLKVISRTSVVALKQRKLTVPELARELKVRHVLEGSLQRSGSRIRVTLQLVDAKNDAHVWSNSYDRDLTDVLALREEIAEKVAEAIAGNVPGAGVVVAAGKDTSPSAKSELCTVYDSFYKGRYWMDRPSPQGLKAAAQAFQSAIDEDANYAPAYVGLSDVLRSEVQFGYREGVDPWADLGQSVALANKAIDLDAKLPQAYFARAAAGLFAWGSPEEVLEDVQRGLALQPNSGELVALHSLALARAGRDAESLRRLGTGLELNPFCPFFRSLVYSTTMLGVRQPEEALQMARKAKELEGDFPLPRLLEALALVTMGRNEECLKLDLSLFPEARAMCLHRLGRVSEAEAIVTPLEAGYRAGRFTSTLQPAYVATYHAVVGDVPGTVEWLTRSFALTPTGVDFRILKSALYDKVRSDPRFTEALEKLQRETRARLFGRVVKA